MKHRARYLSTARDFVRRGHNDVLAHRHVCQEPPNLNRGLSRVRDIAHDNQEIHIAPFARASTRPRAKQHDPRRLESANDAINHRRRYRVAVHDVVSILPSENPSEARNLASENFATSVRA